MNLLLLNDADMMSPTEARVQGRQLNHIHETLKLKEGDTIQLGLENAQLGLGHLTMLSKDEARVSIEWTETPPVALPLTLFIALPRPKMLKRIIQTVATMGVKELYFINSWKVEKSYWQSPWLRDEKIRENCIMGLEQAKDTIMPNIHLRKRFKPFVEDELPALIKESRALLAHPGTSKACPIALKEQVSLAIGPEGGFTPYEVEKLEEAGFESVHLGQRILRVETAVPVLLSRLFCD